MAGDSFNLDANLLLGDCFWQLFSFFWRSFVDDPRTTGDDKIESFDETLLNTGLVPELNDMLRTTLGKYWRCVDLVLSGVSPSACTELVLRRRGIADWGVDNRRFGFISFSAFTGVTAD